MTDKLSLQLADTIMARYPHPDNFPFNSWTYSQGFMLMGFIRLYEDTKETKYRDYALKYADFHVAPDGSMYRFKGDSMDSMMSGAVITWAYHETGEERYRKVSDLILSKFADYPRNSHGGFWHSKWGAGEMWVDGTFMGGMFLTHYATYVGKTEECFAEVTKQLDTLFELCHKQGGLLYHAWSERKGTPWANRITGKSTDVWSEGLGWYAMILAETVRLMPDSYDAKAHLTDRLIQLLDTLSTVQNKDTGLFYQVVDKIENEDNWTDTSGSAMFLYTFTQAVRMGIGDVDTYKQVIEKGYEGIRSKARLNAEGLIDVYDACDGLGVQNNYDAYITFPKAISAKEAVGAVLWASETIEWRL